MTDEQLARLIYALSRLQRWTHEDGLRLAQLVLRTTPTLDGDGEHPGPLPDGPRAFTPEEATPEEASPEEARPEEASPEERTPNGNPS